MKYAITEEQFLMYIYGPKKALDILKNNKSDHYRKSFQKLQNGKSFTWNTFAFIFGSLWFTSKNMVTQFFMFSFGSLFLLSLSQWFGTFAPLFVLLGIRIADGMIAEKLLIKRLSCMIKKSHIDSLSEEFTKKYDLTELDYLRSIYGMEKAQELMKYNVPNYYRIVFKKFSQGKMLVWNWASSLFFGIWPLHRKMPFFGMMTCVAVSSVNISLILWLKPFLDGFKNGGSLSSSSQDMTFFLVIGCALMVFLLISVTFLGCMGNYFLINSISKQKKTLEIEALPEKWTRNFLISLFILWVISVLISEKAMESVWIIIAGQIVYIMPFIFAMIYVKRKIKAYKAS